MNYFTAKRRLISKRVGAETKTINNIIKGNFGLMPKI